MGRIHSTNKLRTMTKGTLEEYAVGLDQLNRDLQRNTDAYAYYRQTVAKLKGLGDKSTAATGLPIITMRFPTAGTTPGETRLDTSSLTLEAQQQLLPLFEALCAVTGEDLLLTWERIISLSSEANDIVVAARDAQDDE